MPVLRDAVEKVVHAPLEKVLDDQEERNWVHRGSPLRRWTDSGEGSEGPPTDAGARSTSQAEAKATRTPA